MGTTKKETDFWGNEIEVHYDEKGKKTGVTKFRKTFWGNTVQDHYDKLGKKVGETRKEEGLFSDKAVHFDAKGKKTGYTKNDETFFGKRYQKHYDTENKKTGESVYDKTFWGKSIKKHKGVNYKPPSLDVPHEKSSPIYSSSFNPSFDRSNNMSRAKSSLMFVCILIYWLGGAYVLSILDKGEFSIWFLLFPLSPIVYTFCVAVMLVIQVIVTAIYFIVKIIFSYDPGYLMLIEWELFAFCILSWLSILPFFIIPLVFQKRPKS